MCRTRTGSWCGDQRVIWDCYQRVYHDGAVLRRSLAAHRGLAMQRPLSWSLRRCPSIGVGRALTTSGSSIDVLADGCALDEMGWSVPVASEPQRRSTWSDP